MGQLTLKYSTQFGKMKGEKLRRYRDSGRCGISLSKSQTKSFLPLPQSRFQSWITSFPSALTSLCCTWQVSSDWFWLYNPCIIEMVISTWGPAAFIGFHCVGCCTWHRASAQRPQTDPTHIRVNTDIWLCPPLASLLKHTSREHNEFATEVMFTHMHAESVLTHTQFILMERKNKPSSKWHHIPFTTTLFGETTTQQLHKMPQNVLEDLSVNNTQK